jgi:putative flippase GtrA
VSITRIALAHLPAAVRPLIVKHRELVKFSLVGATCFLLTAAVNYTLRLTVLTHKPTTALTIATTVATIASYLLNRGWSFRSRGGRERRHEAVLFTLVSVLAIGINSVPLYLARYVFDFQVPHVSRYIQECSDFVSGMLIGTVLAMLFRWWALKKWVFPTRRGTTANARAATDGTPSILGGEAGPEPVRDHQGKTLVSGARARP